MNHRNHYESPINLMFGHGPALIFTVAQDLLSLHCSVSTSGGTCRQRGNGGDRETSRQRHNHHGIYIYIYTHIYIYIYTYIYIYIHTYKYKYMYIPSYL